MKDMNDILIVIYVLFKITKMKKINKLNDNFKILEDLSSNIKDSIKEIKQIIEKNEEDKDILKLEIQNMYTKLIILINNKEDEILLQIDNKHEELYTNKDYIIESEKFPEKNNKSLEKGKMIQTNVDKF